MALHCATHVLILTPLPCTLIRRLPAPALCFVCVQVEPITLRIPLPKSGFSAPNLPELNHSQLHAVRSVLQQPLSLIQVRVCHLWPPFRAAQAYV